MQLEIPLARNTDGHTSHDAAVKAQQRVGIDRAIIYDIVCAAWVNGATMREVAATGRISFVDASRRTAEMERQGLITRTQIGTKMGRHCLIPIYESRNGCAIWRKA